MRLIEVDQNNNAGYKSFVREQGIFLQDFFWGEFQKSQGRIVRRFALVDDATSQEKVLNAPQILGVVQLVQMPALGKFYLHAPCGPLLRDSSRLKFIFDELRKVFPEAIFIRIEPRNAVSGASPASTAPALPQNWPFPEIRKSRNLNPHKTLVLDLSKSTEQLLSEMHQKTRYNIKVAEKSELKIEVIGGANKNYSPEEVFQPMLDAAKRAGIGSFSAQYYQGILDFFGDDSNVSAAKDKAGANKSGADISAKLYIAKHGSDLLAANLMIFYGDTATYLFGGSSNIKRNLMAPYLLHWQAIKDAKAQGFVKYDFWGVEQDPNHSWAGISRFKFGFGGEIKEYAGTYDYVCKAAWYNIYKVVRALNLLRRRITR